jgi:hypothetical protein
VKLAGPGVPLGLAVPGKHVPRATRVPRLLTLLHPAEPCGEGALLVCRRSPARGEICQYRHGWQDAMGEFPSSTSIGGPRRGEHRNLDRPAQERGGSGARRRIACQGRRWPRGPFCGAVPPRSQGCRPRGARVDEARNAGSPLARGRSLHRLQSGATSPAKRTSIDD